MSYLKLLIGKKLNLIDSQFETVIPIKGTKDEVGEPISSIAILLRFEDGYNLSINNPTIYELGQGVRSLENLLVTDTEEDESKAVLTFPNGSSIRIDLRYESYTGPEAMCLMGPNDLIVVWN